MRYRLMATYRGVAYEAGVGPSDSDVVLFAACPPPEELGFEPATGHWRKHLRIQDVQALWESRPTGLFRGEPCIVLDDLGDRVHIAYLGHDASKARSLGYWQVDRGVFELITSRDEVSDVIEERTDYFSGYAIEPDGSGFLQLPLDHAPLPLEAAALRAASAALASARAAQRSSRRLASDPPRRRAARRRQAAHWMFSELASLAAIPASSFAIGAEVDGAMCLVQRDGGFEVFSSEGGTRHEARVFADEESAYFYLFGVLAAEAVRTGILVPRG